MQEIVSYMSPISKNLSDIFTHDTLRLVFLIYEYIFQLFIDSL